MHPNLTGTYGVAVFQLRPGGFGAVCLCKESKACFFQGLYRSIPTGCVLILGGSAVGYQCHGLIHGNIGVCQLPHQRLSGFPAASGVGDTDGSGKGEDIGILDQSVHISHKSAVVKLSFVDGGNAGAAVAVKALLVAKHFQQNRRGLFAAGITCNITHGLTSYRYPSRQKYACGDIDMPAKQQVLLDGPLQAGIFR